MIYSNSYTVLQYSDFIPLKMLIIFPRSQLQRYRPQTVQVKPWKGRGRTSTNKPRSAAGGTSSVFSAGKNTTQCSCPWIFVGSCRYEYIMIIIIITIIIIIIYSLYFPGDSWHFMVVCSEHSRKDKHLDP